jgi:hypothetical protein
MTPKSAELFLDTVWYLNYLAEGIKNKQAFSEGDKERLSHAIPYICDAIDIIETGKIPLPDEQG